MEIGDVQEEVKNTNRQRNSVLREKMKRHTAFTF